MAQGDYFSTKYTIHGRSLQGSVCSTPDQSVEGTCSSGTGKMVILLMKIHGNGLSSVS